MIRMFLCHRDDKEARMLVKSATSQGYAPYEHMGTQICIDVCVDGLEYHSPDSYEQYVESGLYVFKDKDGTDVLFYPAG